MDEVNTCTRIRHVLIDSWWGYGFVKTLSGLLKENCGN